MFELKMKAIAVSVSILPDSQWHGLKHWEQVARNARRLMDGEGFQSDVPIAFAYLHDCMRQNEDADPEHGPRAAKLVTALIPTLNQWLTIEQIYRLRTAVQFHTDGKKSNIPEVAICWDADRLDLPRVGITPHPKYMSTTTGYYSAERSQTSLELQRYG